MIDYLEFIDRQIVLFVNGLHFPFLDHFMWVVSGKLTWIHNNQGWTYYRIKSEKTISSIIALWDNRNIEKIVKRRLTLSGIEIIDIETHTGIYIECYKDGTRALIKCAN